MKEVTKKEGLVCMCAECGKVIRTVGDLEPPGVPILSHGICPACAEKLYGSLFRGLKESSAGGGG